MIADTSEAKAAAPMRRAALAAALLAALAWTTVSGPVLRPLFEDTFVASISYGRSILITAADLAILALVIAVVGGAGLGRQVQLAGLTAPILRPLAFAAILFVPAVAVCAFTTPLSSESSAADYAWLAVGGPVTEEIGYRGLALGALMRICGWRFLPAALAPAILFGLAHFSQGNSPEEIAGVVAITGLGGAFFGWLFVRWGFNLWPAIFLHSGLNALWSAFDLGENAIGGWFGNAVRFSIVGAAVALTLFMTRRR